MGAYLAEWAGRHPELVPARRRTTSCRVKVAIVHSDIFTVSYRRGRGFRQAFEDAGVALDDSLSLQAIGIAEGADAARSVALEDERGVHLIWTDNSENTLGALQALKRAAGGGDPRPLPLRHRHQPARWPPPCCRPARDRCRRPPAKAPARWPRKRSWPPPASPAARKTRPFRHVVLEARVFSRDHLESVGPYLAKEAGGAGEEPCRLSRGLGEPRRRANKQHDGNGGGQGGGRHLGVLLVAPRRHGEEGPPVDHVAGQVGGEQPEADLGISGDGGGRGPSGRRSSSRSARRRWG